MPNRVGTAASVAAAALAMLVVGACSSGSQAASSASVTVNGIDTKIQVVKCSQVEWYRTINIGGDMVGVTINIDERAQPFATTAVRIRNVGGFTGMYSQGGDGNASLSVSDDKFTITGTANGYMTNKPTEPASAAFKIRTTC